MPDRLTTSAIQAGRATKTKVKIDRKQLVYRLFEDKVCVSVGIYIHRKLKARQYKHISVNKQRILDCVQAARECNATPVMWLDAKDGLHWSPIGNGLFYPVDENDQKYLVGLKGFKRV